MNKVSTGTELDSHVIHNAHGKDLVIKKFNTI